ncbi:glycosyltransferase family 4 protein [Vibrio sp. 10N.247.311.59]|uniref:glycosyltransferase family 4 protein n=1 Tax=Vibrio sp. 10N.247.311.59 TaxID=3229989 RepID=UPI0035503F34
MNKRIVFTSNTSWYLYNFRSSSIRHLILSGYEVTCISPKDDYSEKLVKSLGCNWMNVKMNNKGRNPFEDIQLIYHFYKLIKSIGPSIVFNFTVKNNVYSTAACGIIGIPVVNNISGLGTAFIERGLTSYIVSFLYRVTQPFASMVYCQNSEDLKLLTNHNLVNKSKLGLLPGSGVDTNRFRPVKRVPNEKFTFLFVGRMLFDKGLRELIEASRSLYECGYEFNLYFCGFRSSDNRSSVPSDIFDQWVNLPFVTYLGPTDEVDVVYGKADCVVLPSYREGLPRTLIESGSMGIPSITTNVPGCKHVVTDGFNGLVCNVKDVQSLSDCMTKILTMDEKERTRLGVNARRRVKEKYDEQLVISELMENIEKFAIN